MNSRDIIAKLQEELNTEMYNTMFMQKSIPPPIVGNRYETYRADAPFYCCGSKQFLINAYEDNKSWWSEMIRDSHNNKTLCTDDKNHLCKALAHFAIDYIKQINGGRASTSQLIDLQEVAAHIGLLVFVVIHVNMHFTAFNTIFLETWSRYFTNEIVGNVI